MNQVVNYIVWFQKNIYIKWDLIIELRHCCIRRWKKNGIRTFIKKCVKSSKCKKLAHLICPWETSNTQHEKNHNPRLLVQQSCLKFLAFSSWHCIVCPTYHLIESDAPLIFFLRMLGHVSQERWNIIGM